MNIVAIVQARMGSTRLPGKVLSDIEGQSMLSHVVNRARQANKLDKIVIATTEKPDDDLVMIECERIGIPSFRGAEDDVLDRYYRAARSFRAEYIVRITSDCPLIDPEIIDVVIEEFLAHEGLDYASNSLPPRTFPRGLDVEVMTIDALERAWQEDKNPAWREHVTPYIYRHPEKFNLKTVTSEVDYSYMRWTVDTEEDLTFVRKIYKHFGNDNFSWKEVIRLLNEHPEYLDINRHIVQKEVPG